MSEQNEKVVELEKTIKPSLLEDNNKNVSDKPSSFSQKVMNLFFSNTKNEDIEEEIVKAIIRDDIENPVPVLEEMLRDEIVEPLVKEVVVKEPLVKELVVKEPLVKEIVVKEPLVKEVVVKELLVKEVVVKEPLVKEPLVLEPAVKTEILSSLVELPPVKKLLASEIDVKLKRPKFFCCYM